MQPLAWYYRPPVLWAIGLISLGLTLLIIGIILHNVVQTVRGGSPPGLMLLHHTIPSVRAACALLNRTCFPASRSQRGFCITGGRGHCLF